MHGRLVLLALLTASAGCVAWAPSDVVTAQSSPGGHSPRVSADTLVANSGAVLFDVVRDVRAGELFTFDDVRASPATPRLVAADVSIDVEYPTSPGTRAESVCAGRSPTTTGSIDLTLLGNGWTVDRHVEGGCRYATSEQTSETNVQRAGIVALSLRMEGVSGKVSVRVTARPVT